MSARYNVNVNSFSTPFSTQPSTIAARNEERRLERIYGGDQKPKRTYWDDVVDSARAQERKERGGVADRARFATTNLPSVVNFQGRQYTLPPLNRQELNSILTYGSVEDHFGGLGLRTGMFEWHDKFVDIVSDHSVAAIASNKAALKQAKGGLFKKSSVPQLEKVISEDEVWEVFNFKLAKARVAARIEMSPSHTPMVVHPSSEGGDLLGAMKNWADAHWKGVPEKSWDESLPILPRFMPVSGSEELTALMGGVRL